MEAKVHAGHLQKLIDVMYIILGRHMTLNEASDLLALIAKMQEEDV